MATLAGRNAAVKIGTNTVVGMGKWTIEGVSVDQIDVSAFGTVWKTFEAGMVDGGTVSFDGYYDKTDTTGQTLLIAANVAGTHLTSIRFYVDATSYYIPEYTTQGAYVLITGYTITHDKADVARISFQGKVSGYLSLI